MRRPQRGNNRPTKLTINKDTSPSPPTVPSNQERAVPVNNPQRVSAQGVSNLNKQRILTTQVKTKEPINEKALSPINRVGLGMYNTGSDYANIINADYEDKSILNQAIGHAFEGKWDKAGHVIKDHPYRFAGNLLVEAGLAVVPVGAVLKVAKVGKIAKTIAGKTWKAPDTSDLSKAKQNDINQLKNIKNSPGEPQRYQTGFDDTIKRVEDAESFKDLKKNQLDFQAYGPDVTTPLQQSVTSKISTQVKIIKSKITGSKSITASGINASDEVLFSSKHALDPSIFAHFSTDPINAGKVHLNVGADMFRFTDDELIRQVGGSISEEVIHNTLRKDIGVKAAKQWDAGPSRPYFNTGNKHYKAKEWNMGVSGKDIKNIATGRGVGNDTGASVNPRPENPGQQWYRWTGKEGPSKDAANMVDIWSTKYYTPKVKSNPKILPNPLPFTAKLIEKNEEKKRVDKNAGLFGGYGQFLQ